MDHDASTTEEPVDEERPCILVAEDDQDMREDVAGTLRAEGYRVIELESGERVLRYLRSASAPREPVPVPDVIVSDLRMPGISGLELLESLRDVACAIPVILMTAFGDPETHQEARRLGAVATLDKPFAAVELRTAVLTALQCGGR